jgi:hypothetical protein
MAYQFTGPINPDGGISIDQANNIGESIANAYQEGYTAAAATTSSPGQWEVTTPTIGAAMDWKAPVVLAGCALFLLAFAATMKD